jgi:hypothetical protein
VHATTVDSSRKGSLPNALNGPERPWIGSNRDRVIYSTTIISYFSRAEHYQAKLSHYSASTGTGLRRCAGARELRFGGGGGRETGPTLSPFEIFPPITHCRKNICRDQDCGTIEPHLMILFFQISICIPQHVTKTSLSLRP